VPSNGAATLAKDGADMTVGELDAWLRNLAGK